MEKDVAIKKWKEETPPVEFTFKKKNKSIFELEEKSLKDFGPTLIDCYDDARTASEREIFDGMIKRENTIVRRMIEAREQEHVSERKIEKLKEQNKNLLPDARRGKKILSSTKKGGEIRSETFRQFYKLYQKEAQRLKNNGHLKTKRAIGTHIARNLPSEIRDFLKEHSLDPLSVDRISRVI